MQNVMGLMGLMEEPQPPFTVQTKGRRASTLRTPRPKKPKFTDEVMEELSATPPGPVEALKERLPKKKKKRVAAPAARVRMRLFGPSTKIKQLCLKIERMQLRWTS